MAPAEPAEPAPGDDGRDRPLPLSGLLDEGAADLTTLSSPDGLYSYVSPASRRILGYEPSELVGHQAREFVHPEDVELAEEARATALSLGGVVVSRHRLACADGGYLWTESAVRAVRRPGPDGGLVVLSSIRDIADRTVVEGRLERQALTDPLTGIANRTVFMDRLGQALRRLHRSRAVLAVVYLDLDRFKLVNDLLGHKAGDELLLRVAERTLRSLRPSDTLARLGGDEFVVLAEDLESHEEATQLAERICAAVEEPFELDGEAFVCTVSAGVATTTDAAHLPEALVQEADLALYRAKGEGRNRAAVFDEELRATAVGRLATEQMLRRAVAEDRLIVHYQPIIDLTSGRVVEAEALVRLEDGGRVILAERFVAVAEETGLLVMVGASVLPRALDQAVRWRQRFGADQFPSVSVNMSARQLADANLVHGVDAALTAAGLPAQALSIEMSERVLMDAANSAMTNLREIRRLGVRIGLDDFGSGYSSLAYLRRLPLDFVKIDRSFVEELSRSTRDAAVVAGVVDLAHALGLTVVAEGVETERQLRMLTDLRCDRAQGFVIGAACEPEELMSFIAWRDNVAGRATA